MLHKRKVCYIELHHRCENLDALPIAVPYVHQSIVANAYPLGLTKLPFSITSPSKLVN